MKQFLRENRCFRKRLTNTKKRIIKIFQVLNVTTLQQMNGDKKNKWKDNKCRWKVDEKDEKKELKRNSRKKKLNSNTMMFESINVKNSTTRTFIMFYINETTSFANTFISKCLFDFESFLKIESNALTKAQAKKKLNKSFEKTIKKTSKAVNFFSLFDVYMNKFLETCTVH